MKKKPKILELICSLQINVKRREKKNQIIIQKIENKDAFVH